MHPSESFWCPFRMKINLLFLRHQFQVTFFFFSCDYAAYAFSQTLSVIPLVGFPKATAVIHLINVLNKWMKLKSWVSVPSINQSRWKLLKYHTLPDAHRIVERGLAWSYRGILFQCAALWPHSSVCVSVSSFRTEVEENGSDKWDKSKFCICPLTVRPLLQFLESLADILNVETLLLFLTTLLSSQLSEGFWRRTE